MSKEKGEAYLNDLISKTLETNPTYKALQENYRKELNKQTHILDISRKSLMVNVKSKSSEEIDLFNNSYDEFIDLVYTSASQVLPNIASMTIIPKGTTFIENPPLLINISFEAARTFITERISRVIPDNPYFGVSNRVRTLAEYIALGFTKKELEGMDKYFNSQGLEKLSKYSKVLRVQALSVLDLGHTYTGEATRESPLGSKLEGALNISEPNSAIKSLVQNAISDLTSIQAECGYTFQNNIPEGLSKRGFLTLTLHFYKKNGEFAKVEGSIFAKILKDIKTEIVKEVESIPGSNTMEQDAKALVKKLIVDSIKGKRTADNLPSHALLSNTVKSKPKNIKVDLVKSSNIPITKPKVAPTPPPKAKPSLTSLQSLINSQLQNVISANMGDGSSKRILNYRTGRFAESVKVETMSQSRQDMITAFYSYMKNPYQTFEPGFKQGTPKSRDPKLLISQSIREIAATRVGNQLRAQAL